jgi:hypothetical protein
MTVRRFSISFEEELAAAVSASAENANEALSSWLAEAARRRVKQEALARALKTTNANLARSAKTMLH